ncbi:YeeE/YedE family protein [Telmatospirillum sp. J64-1]|uniref:YeeE/YedE family protein n=1 Tax=Telmatospirillum sp. J64-1 TaxID=2502183 RepID=UPI00115E1CE1|nr:YeeE/YedE family protein [Telmatospirillum sp. J64-1]
MENFTPLSAAIGGLLIGLSAALLWIGNGRIAGISGILGGLVSARPGNTAWRAAFLAGMIAAPLLYGLLGGTIPTPTVAATPGMVVAAGLLVGFGTRLGSGCTSGHAVCGLARLSRRSLAATALFMATAILTVFVTRHLLGA